MSFGRVCVWMNLRQIDIGAHEKKNMKDFLGAFVQLVFAGASFQDGHKTFFIWCLCDGRGAAEEERNINNHLKLYLSSE